MARVIALPIGKQRWGIGIFPHGSPSGNSSLSDKVADGRRISLSFGDGPGKRSAFSGSIRLCGVVPDKSKSSAISVEGLWAENVTSLFNQGKRKLTFCRNGHQVCNSTKVAIQYLRCFCLVLSFFCLWYFWIFVGFCVCFVLGTGFFCSFGTFLGTL